VEHVKSKEFQPKPHAYSKVAHALVHACFTNKATAPTHRCVTDIYCYAYLSLNHDELRNEHT
jgi:hypothetical protein